MSTIPFLSYFVSFGVCKESVVRVSMVMVAKQRHNDDHGGDGGGGGGDNDGGGLECRGDS